ncbi:MAG: tryptophan halogenase family protein [Pacificimonas sp.]
MAGVTGAKRHIVIVGGGTAGWMMAAGMGALLGRRLEVTLVESEAIGTVGVGEATLPHIRNFNSRIGVGEADFMRATQATIKLGIEFVDWYRKGTRYIHPFGAFGHDMAGAAFHHHWLRARASGDETSIFDYSLPVVAAAAGKFAPPSKNQESIYSTYNYAFQFDAGLYAKYLRGFAETRGVTREEGRVVSVRRDGESGLIASVTLDDGRVIAGDIFIDCSGFRGLLIEGELKTGYREWTRWLPCDRAVAVPCEKGGDFVPYTRATARDAGWQWRIPLQHRTGNGYVYSSAHISDDEATATLLANLEGEPEADPRLLRFVTGQRKLSWNRNVVAVGLSGGFLEPLESTSIYLIQQAITNFIELLPEHADDPVPRAEYNRLMDLEFERVRDFLILHYHATEREDTAFWDQCRTMDVPDSLKEKMELWRATGHVTKYKDGLFLEASWLAVYLGQGVVPRRHSPLVESLPDSERAAHLSRLRDMTAKAAAKMPSHADWIARHAAAGA